MSMLLSLMLPQMVLADVAAGTAGNAADGAGAARALLLRERDEAPPPK